MKIIIPFLLTVIIIFGACTGKQGPQGLVGPSGPSGNNGNNGSSGTNSSSGQYVYITSDTTWSTAQLIKATVYIFPRGNINNFTKCNNNLLSWWQYRKLWYIKCYWEFIK